MSISLIRFAFQVMRPDRIRFLGELEKSQWYSREDLIQLQRQKLRNLLEHAYLHVPYYMRVFDDLKLNPRDLHLFEDFKETPFLKKEDIIANFTLLQASNYKKTDLLPNTTGGSTGVHLEFISDRKASNYLLALSLRNTRWAGWDIGDKQAQLWGSLRDLSGSEKIKNRLKNYFIHRNLFLSSYDLTKENMFAYCRKINRIKPKLITGYASALHLFARFLEDNKLDIHSPRAIMSSAEVLEEYQRTQIESVFRCKVFDRYGSREVSNIACECEKHNGMHINAEHVYLEVVDEKGNICKPGEMGEIVVTDLDNYAFPFIRYRIGDMGELSDKKCPCGRGLPLVKKLKGRVVDVIVTQDGKYLCVAGVLFWTEGIKGIRKFQLIQEDLNHITVNILKNAAFSDEEKLKLERKIKGRIGEKVAIHIQIVDEIPLSSSGKHRYIISKISPFMK